MRKCFIVAAGFRCDTMTVQMRFEHASSRHCLLSSKCREILYFFFKHIFISFFQNALQERKQKDRTYI